MGKADKPKIDFYLCREIEKWKDFPIAKKYENEFEIIQKHLVASDENPFYSIGGNFSSSRIFIPFKLASVSNYNLLYIDNSFCTPYKMDAKSIQELGSKYDLEKTLIAYQPFYTGNIQFEDLSTKINLLKSFQIPCCFIDFNRYDGDIERRKLLSQYLYHSVIFDNETGDDQYCIDLFEFFFQEKMNIEIEIEQKIRIGRLGSKCLNQIKDQFNMDDSLSKKEWLDKMERVIFGYTMTID